MELTNIHNYCSTDWMDPTADPMSQCGNQHTFLKNMDTLQPLHSPNTCFHWTTRWVCSRLRMVIDAQTQLVQGHPWLVLPTLLLYLCPRWSHTVHCAPRAGGVLPPINSYKINVHSISLLVMIITHCNLHGCLVYIYILFLYKLAH